MNKVYLTKEYIYTSDKKIENNNINLNEIKDKNVDAVLSLDYFDLIDKIYFSKDIFTYRYNNVLNFKINFNEINELKKYFRNYTNILEFLKISENDELLYYSNKYVIYLKFVMNQIVEIEKIDVNFNEIKDLDIGNIKVITDDYLLKQIYENDFSYKKYSLNKNNYILKFYNFNIFILLITILVINYFNYIYFRQNIYLVESFRINEDENDKYLKEINDLIKKIEYEKNIKINIDDIEFENIEIENLRKVLKMLIKIYDNIGIEYKKIIYEKNNIKVVSKIDDYNKYKLLHNYLDKYYILNLIELKNIFENDKEFIEYIFNMYINENKI